MGNRFCCDISQQNHLGPMSEPVNASWYIKIILTGRPQSNEIDMKVAQLDIWLLKSFKGCAKMVHFRFLAMQTCAGPWSNILLHVGPKDTSRNKPDRGSDTRVWQGKQCEENMYPKTSENKRAWMASGNHTISLPVDGNGKYFNGQDTS